MIDRFARRCLLVLVLLLFGLAGASAQATSTTTGCGSIRAIGHQFTVDVSNTGAVAVGCNTAREVMRRYLAKSRGRDHSPRSGPIAIRHAGRRYDCYRARTSRDFVCGAEGTFVTIGARVRGKNIPR